MNKTNPRVDVVIKRAKKWQKELETLRTIVLGFPLTEELKWGKPFYTHENANVIVLWAFQAHCALGFCKGALLKDPKKLLIKPGENTQAVRKIPFTSAQEIIGMEAILKTYIREAIDIEKAGLEVTFKKITEFPLPEELEEKLANLPDLKKAYDALSPGRQRAYLLHFSAPKQSSTRRARIEKYIPQILKGQGIDHEYRSTRNKKTAR